jgi:uncharacterized protein YjbI with pentapeptide repeats
MDQDASLMDLTEVPASEILEKIKKGLPVNYNRIKILDVLDVSSLNMSKKHVHRYQDEIDEMGLKEDLTVIPAHISITNSEINGITGFSNAIFENGVSFKSSMFSRDADFRGSQFTEFADFSGSNLSGSSSFLGAKITIRDQTIQAQRILDIIEMGIGIDCERVTVEGDVDLSRLKNVEIKNGSIFQRFDYQHFYGLCTNGLKVIKSSLEFKNTNFLGKLNFSCCQFKRDIDFWICALTKDAVFERSLFCGNVQFRRVGFQKYSVFRGSQFIKDADFQWSIFVSGPDFSDVGFTCHANFNKAEFKDFANFNSSIFNNIVSFEYAKINSMSLEAKYNVNSKITLRESNFRNLKVPWKLIKNRLIYSTEISSSKMLIDKLTYLNLIKNFNEIGWFDDADSCYLEYKKLLKKKDFDSLSRLPSKIRNRVLKYQAPFSKKVSSFIKEVCNGCDALIKVVFYYISLIFYGHGVRLRMPFFVGAGLIVLFACIYTYNGQANSLWPRGFIISAKSFIGITQLQRETLTGPCEYWSILERFLGTILLVTFTLVLGKKTLR